MNSHIIFWFNTFRCPLELCSLSVKCTLESLPANIWAMLYTQSRDKSVIYTWYCYWTIQNMVPMKYSKEVITWHFDRPDSHQTKTGIRVCEWMCECHATLHRSYQNRISRISNRANYVSRVGFYHLKHTTSIIETLTSPYLLTKFYFRHNRFVILTCQGMSLYDFAIRCKKCHTKYIHITYSAFVSLVYYMVLMFAYTHRWSILHGGKSDRHLSPFSLVWIYQFVAVFWPTRGLHLNRTMLVKIRMRYTVDWVANISKLCANVIANIAVVRHFQPWIYLSYVFICHSIFSLYPPTRVHKYLNMGVVCVNAVIRSTVKMCHAWLIPF